MMANDRFNGKKRHTSATANFVQGENFIADEAVFAPRSERHSRKQLSPMRIKIEQSPRSASIASRFPAPKPPRAAMGASKLTSRREAVNLNHALPSFLPNKTSAGRWHKSPTNPTEN